MASKNQEYAAQYAECAMAQMRRYGIPASVILAQGILESSNGQSRLALAENNHFGIKATPEWIAQGGRYGLYTDDKPNEKFCSYESVGESYEHHSRFLKENGRYARCFALAPDDYKGWTQGLEQAGYATGGRYADSLQRIIEQNGLQRYDRQVMREMEAQGKRFGVEESPLREAETAAEYAFPVEREEFLFVASPFGMRPDPENGTKQQMHKGIDIRCKDDAALATECGGKVVAVGGNSVTVEYARADGSRVQCTYMHLGDMAVKAGDTVQAGQRLGTAGKDGGHLHFGVRQLSADGTQRDVDPVVEMAVTAFASLMLLAVQIDGRSEQEQKAAVSAAADRRRIDLKPLLPGMRSCELAIGENGRATLLADNGNVRVSRELTPAEMSRLSAALNDGTLSEEARRMRVAGLLNSVVLAETASRNFELGMAEQRGQTENLKR